MEKTAVKALLLSPTDASYQRIQRIVERVLQSSGIAYLSVSDLPTAPGRLIVNEVSDAIRASDLILADVSRLNPNVLYELGFACALRRTTVLLVEFDSAKDVPSSLAGYHAIYYDPDDLSTLASGLLRFIKSQDSRLQGVEVNV